MGQLGLRNVATRGLLPQQREVRQRACLHGTLSRMQVVTSAERPHRARARTRILLCCLVSLSCISCDAATAPKPTEVDAGSEDAGSFLIHKSDASTRDRQPETPCDSTYIAVARLVFVGAHCTTSNCHAPGPDAPAVGLDLTESKAYALLVDIAPAAHLDASFRRVTPGDEQTSLLYRKLIAAEPAGEKLPDNAGLPMPIQLPPVAPENLSALRAWIRAGANETGVAPGTEDFVARCAAASQ